MKINIPFYRVLFKNEKLVAKQPQVLVFFQKSLRSSVLKLSGEQIDLTTSGFTKFTT